MTTDEQRWEEIKESYHREMTAFFNYLQTVSANDLQHNEVLKKLVMLRFEIFTQHHAFYRFLDDANFQYLNDILQPKKW